jgi:hypothetical protein
MATAIVIPQNLTATNLQPKPPTPKRYEAKKQKRRPQCAIPGCLNPAQSADSPHCRFHQPPWGKLFDELIRITATS